MMISLRMAASRTHKVGMGERVRAEAQWPNDKIIVTGIGEDGMPQAAHEQKRMKKLVGLIARQKVSLVLPSFKLLVKRKGKVIPENPLFTDYVMPYLEVRDDMKPKAQHMALKRIGRCWINHKSRLRNEFLLKNCSPFQRFKYLKKEDWEAFAEMCNSEGSKLKSEKMKKLRKKNKHNHRLGTAGYEGKILIRQAEDANMAKEGRLNPWLQFPGRSHHWLRARGNLTESGEISFHSQETKEVSNKIKEYSEDSARTEEREDNPQSKEFGPNDLLSKALDPEHPGRVRAFSSYSGWKVGWPGYRRPNSSSGVDIEQLTKNIQDKVTQDIIAKLPTILASQGLKLVPMTPSPNQVSPADAYRSRCASDGNGEHDLYAEMMQQVAQEPETPDSIDLLSEPTPCALLGNIDGYQVEVARGQVYPQQNVLHSVPIRAGCVVVFVDCVGSKHRDYKLDFPPNDEITTLRQALLQRIQWSRLSIVLNPSEMQAPDPEDVPASQPKHRGESQGKLVPCDKQPEGVPASQPKHRGESQGKPVPCANQPEKGAKSDSQGSQKKAKMTSKVPSDAAKSSKRPGLPKAPPDVARKGASKSSKEAKHGNEWAMDNSAYIYGKEMLSTNDLQKAAPSCTNLHNYYLNGVER